MSDYDIAKVRKKLQEQKGSRFKDANEFRPPKADETQTLKYRFYILPPLNKGDKCADGVASQSMDLFYVVNGAHWVNNRTNACPRVHDEQPCDLCALGFELIGDTPDKKQRSALAKQFLPRTQYAVNIYFPKDNVNPEDVAGKVMWMNAPKTLYDMWEACIMNDSEGDEDDKQAFGVFFDENAAYLFQLLVKKKNEWNDYSASKFIASAGKRPLAVKDGKPLEARIVQILGQRHDLFTKFQARDPEAITKLTAAMKSGDPTPAGAGFDEDETEKPSKPVAQPKTVAKPKPVKPKPEPVEEAVEVVDEVEAATIEVEGNLGEEVETKPTKQDKPAVSDDVEDAQLQELLDEIDKPD